MHPIIKVFGRDFSSYGALALVGMVVVLGYSAIVNRKTGRDFFDRFLFVIYAFLGSFVGAFILYQITIFKYTVKGLPFLFTDFNEFKKYLSFGLVYYGGLIGIFVGMMIYAVYFKEDVRYWIRMQVPSIPLFHIFGRIGCTVGGCCYGIILDNPKGGVYNLSLDKYCLPIQLYEAALDAIIFIVLILFLKFQADKNEYYKVMGLYFILYAVIRFILEFWRGDKIRGVWGGLSTSQYISIILIPIGIYCLVCPATKCIFEKWYNGEQYKN